MDALEKPEAPRPTGGYSLASLALMVTLCAVFLASIDVQRCREQLSRMWERDLVFVVVVFVVAGMVGGLIGFFRVIVVEDFTWKMLFAAMFGGTIAGLAAVLILVAPGPLWRTLLAIGILLATINVMQLSSE